ncbi:MAG: DUF4430 domain-containing protein [Candidatus Bathyarchaeia archaeon]|nr:DUF4430 domain-containing protein [Candidatus Bathyarchaeota archaeon]
MNGKSPWMWVSLGLLCLLIVAAYLAIYYYNESAYYKALYERASSDLKRLTMPVNILIDYGNETRMWYNSTLVPRESSLFFATKIVASVESISYPEMGEFVTSINGVGGEPNKYWMWYTWNPEKGDWDLGPVACDKYILRENETVMWRYEKFEF